MECSNKCPIHHNGICPHWGYDNNKKKETCDYDKFKKFQEERMKENGKD